jgi:hypothetical protein
LHFLTTDGSLKRLKGTTHPSGRSYEETNSFHCSIASGNCFLRTKGYYDPRIVPGAGIVLNPPDEGNRGEISGTMIEKDFVDKAYSADPILPSMMRDRFLYFSIHERPASIKGFELRFPESGSLPHGLKLKF